MKKIYSFGMICLLCAQLVQPVYGAQPEAGSPDGTTQVTAQEIKNTEADSSKAETTKDTDQYSGGKGLSAAAGDNR